jgi:hypothetical protein
MIPLRVLMDVEQSPIYEEGTVLAIPGLLDVTAVGVLTKGTAEGAPTVTVRMDTPDGKVVFGQTSLRLFCAAARAFAARYGEFLK